MFSVNYIFLLNITYVFAIITCLGFLVYIVTVLLLTCLVWGGWSVAGGYSVARSPTPAPGSSHCPAAC